MKPTIVIVAGGLATRMKPITEEIPKCLVDINGKPLIQHQLEFFRKKGFTDFIFCVAHLSGKVKKYFGDGKKFGVNIRYSEEPKELLGTAGAVKLVQKKVKGTFIIYYGDNLTTMNFDDLLDFHKKRKSDFTVVVRNLPKNYISSSIITMSANSRIKVFLEKPSQEYFKRLKTSKKYINNGIYVVEPKILRQIPANKKYDFAKDLIPKLIKQKKNIFGYVSDDFFREVGRVEKYEQLKKEMKSENSVFSAQNRAVFMDRDGVINEGADKILKPEDFKLLPGAAEAIRKINKAGYLAIVVSNQPNISKGFLTLRNLDRIHSKMNNILAKKGAHIDAIYVCPHHPEKGFDGEIKALKIKCSCRKPEPGLLLQAIKEHNIDRSKSYFIGDMNTDVLAGKAAGVKTILVTAEIPAHKKQGALDTKPDLVKKNLLEAVKEIINY